MAAAVPVDWRRGTVERADLERFLFAPDDIVVAVGQDGLVANVAKYLDDAQVVVGIDPEPGRNPGILVRHPAADAAALLADVAAGRAYVESRTMVQATPDNGQTLRALNEIYIGSPTHQTARYRISVGEYAERQASSGVLVGTGTGATGWCRSAWLERRSSLRLPEATNPELVWFVREAWPSPVTGVTLTEGTVAGSEQVTLIAESDALVAFGDGIETDALSLSWGQTLTVGVAGARLRLV